MKNNISSYSVYLITFAVMAGLAGAYYSYRSIDLNDEEAEMAVVTQKSKGAERRQTLTGSGREALKRRMSDEDKRVSQNQNLKEEGEAVTSKSDHEEQSIIIGTVDPLERGATRNKHGDYVAKTRAAYKPSKKIARHAFATYVPVKYAEGDQPSFQGDPVIGFISLPRRGNDGAGKGRFELKPNGNGEFPRIYVAEEEEVEVRLLYPEAKEGAQYAVAAQDGGLLDDGFPTAMVVADKNKEVAFRFAPSANVGTHRIVVRSTAGEATILDLWVGDEVVFAKSNKK